MVRQYSKIQIQRSIESQTDESGYEMRKEVDHDWLDSKLQLIPEQDLRFIIKVSSQRYAKLTHFRNCLFYCQMEISVNY